MFVPRAEKILCDRRGQNGREREGQRLFAVNVVNEIQSGVFVGDQPQHLFEIIDRGGQAFRPKQTHPAKTAASV